MTVLAATATATGGLSWALGLALVAAGIISWITSIWLHPFTVCSRCGGSGRNQGSTGRAYGRCPRCKGKPERLRRGARLFGRGTRR